MPRLRPLLCLFVFAASIPLSAQGGLSAADEKELASYRLSMATVKKVGAAMQAMADEMGQDPQFQRIAKLESEIDAIEAQVEKLNEKDELTPADESRIEGLTAQLEKLQEQKERLEDENPDNSMSKARTITEMEEGVRKVPVMVRGLERAGLTPREYAKFMLAMLQASMVYGFSQGKVDYAKLPPGVNPENVKFVAEHQAELQAMQKEFAALDPRTKKR
jgi:hypothetical protein